jgi:O-antigen/teichoic acid export membrane protein
MAGGIVKNSLLSAVAGAATLLGGLISTIVVARLLGVAATGAIAYATWLATMAVTLLDLGAQATLARFLPELQRQDGERAADLASALFRLYAAVSGVVVLGVGVGVALFSGASIGNMGRVPAIVAIAALCVLQSLANFGLGEVRGRQAFATGARILLVSMLLQISFVTIGAMLFGELGVLFGYICGSAPMATRALRLVARRTRGALALDRRYVRFALFAWAGGIASALVWSRSEVFFLQRSWGPEAVALLVAGLTLANLAAQGPLLLTGALLPFFSSKGDADRAAFDRAFASGTRILAFLALPLCFGAAGVMPGLVHLFFGARFAGASLPGAIIVIAAGLTGPSAVGTHVLYARDRSDFIFLCSLTGAVVSVVAGLTVIPAFGLLGAACSRAVIQVGLAIWGFRFIQSRLGCPVPIAHLWRLVVSAALCSAAAFATLQASPVSIALGPAVLVGAVVYFVCVRWLGALPGEDLQRLAALAELLPAALRWAPTVLTQFLARAPALSLVKPHV